MTDGGDSRRSDDRRNNFHIHSRSMTTPSSAETPAPTTRRVVALDLWRNHDGNASSYRARPLVTRQNG